MRITSDMGQASPDQNLPLLTKDSEGNEVDWRTKYACTCPPTDDPNAPPTCDGCIALRGILDRLRADRRTRQMRETRGVGTPTRSKARVREDDIA